MIRMLLVKVGKMDISFDTDFAGYPTIAEALGKPLEIGTIPLLNQQLE